MRNREAARYARWSAIAAGLIVLVVAGVYVYRAVMRARARSHMPAAVPASVKRQSAEFTFSKVDQDRTVFTIRASQATQYKDRNRALLQDVWITIYGRDGKQNDDIHTRECSYDPQSGGARCRGTVQIDIDAAKPTANHSGNPALRLVTSDLAFNRDTGDASTAAPVQFTFPGGSGSGIGVKYSTRDATARIENAIKFQLAASEKTGGLPVSATGSSLEIHRSDRTAVLNGPVNIREGDRRLSAAKVSVEFDAANRARRVLIEGRPQIRAKERGSTIAISADAFKGLLNPAGWLERVSADGNVRATRSSTAGTGRFGAEHVEFAMAPRSNLIEKMTARGGVTAQSKQGAEFDALKTDALRVVFSTTDANGTSRGKSSPNEIARQRIESAESLAPATIELSKGKETTTLKAEKLAAKAGPDGHIEKLLGHSGVTIRRQVGAEPPQTISAPELTATLGAHGEWETVEETGGVQARQGEREVNASTARIDRATDMVALEGSPVVTDGASRTSAESMKFNQKTGALQATGRVVSTYVPSSQQDAVSLGSGAAHISADALTGSTASGHASYEGHVRLWQGDSVLQADRVDLWRDEKKLQASGNVVAVFPQTAGPAIPDFEKLGSKAGKASGPDLWKIRAPMLTYWGAQGRAHLDGGVVATSAQGTLHARTLDVYLTSAGPAQHPSEAENLGRGRQLDRVVARGDVVVQQGIRRGMAAEAKYTAADGKFVLSGGRPTITDGSSNTATGSSLTFYVASDTILIDSQEGSRTLTKHKVQK